MTRNDEKLSVLFEELVPMFGKAESLAGETVRAAMRISYRNWNDGDHIGVGYGKETCNPAARFLIGNTPEEIGSLVRALWGMVDDTAYDTVLDVLVGKVADYVNNHPELRDKPTDDMLSYWDPDEDVDDFREEEEDSCEDEDCDW